ncbi:hypothetical protein MKD33_13920, partial [Chromobacterium piscinae]
MAAFVALTEKGLP